VHGHNRVRLTSRRLQRGTSPTARCGPCGGRHPRHALLRPVRSADVPSGRLGRRSRSWCRATACGLWCSRWDASVRGATGRAPWTWPSASCLPAWPSSPGAARDAVQGAGQRSGRQVVRRSA